nr:hypothetical protein [Streptomyces sp. NP160]
MVTILVTATRDQRRGALGGVAADTRQQVAVRVGREGDRGVSEPLGDHGDRHARGEHQRGLAVAEVVQADPAEAGCRGQLREARRDVVGQHRRAVLPGEDEPVVVVGVGPQRLLGVLAQAVLEQHAERGGVEVDQAVVAAGGLGWAEGDAAVPVSAGRTGVLASVFDLQHLLADRDDAAWGVEVGPPQPERLTAAQARRGHHLEQHAKTVVRGVVQEGPELSRVPRHDAGPGDLGQLEVGRSVERDQPPALGAGQG